MDVDYVYVNAEAIDPMNRVAPLEYASGHDVNKYAEMMLDVAEAVLGVFEFSRTKLGFQLTPRNFLEELMGGRYREVVLEPESLGEGLRSLPRRSFESGVRQSYC